MGDRVQVRLSYDRPVLRLGARGIAAERDGVRVLLNAGAPVDVLCGIHAVHGPNTPRHVGSERARLAGCHQVEGARMVHFGEECGPHRTRGYQHHGDEADAHDDSGAGGCRAVGVAERIALRHSPDDAPEGHGHRVRQFRQEHRGHQQGTYEAHDSGKKGDPEAGGVVVHPQTHRHTGPAEGRHHDAECGPDAMAFPGACVGFVDGRKRLNRGNFRYTRGRPHADHECQEGSEHPHRRQLQRLLAGQAVDERI